MKRYILIKIFHGKHKWWRPFWRTYRHKALQFYEKRNSSQMLSCKICEVLRKIILTEHCGTTASDFQQHFERIACFISSKSTQSKRTTETVAQRCSVKKGVLRSFAKVTRKHLCQSLFLNKVAGWKETLTQVFSCDFCQISKKTFFYRTPLVTASETI